MLVDKGQTFEDGYPFITKFEGITSVSFSEDEALHFATSGEYHKDKLPILLTIDFPANTKVIPMCVCTIQDEKEFDKL